MTEEERDKIISGAFLMMGELIEAVQGIEAYMEETGRELSIIRRKLDEGLVTYPQSE